MEDSDVSDEEETNEVIVVDTTPADITLNGERTITLERAVDEYVEEGAIAKDGTDPEVTIENPTKINYRDMNGEFKGQVDKVDVNTVGEYKLSYEYTDEYGNSSFKVRVVNVVDTKAPLLTLNGDSKITVDKGSEYVDEGAIATDDGNIVTELEVVKINYSVDGEFVGSVDKVDTSKVGTYKIVYQYTDPYGNEAVDANKTSHNYLIKTVEVVETEGTATLIVNYTTKDGQVVATEEFSEVAQKGEFTWVYGENYQITNPEGYVVTGYEGITKEMTVEIIGGQNTVTEGKAIVEPVKVATGDEETTTPPTKGDKEEAKAETDAAKTSDPMTLGLLLAAMGASGAGIAGLRRRNK